MPLRRPTTVQLDSMLQLVLNCRQRSRFLAQYPPNDRALPEVPEPGVPFNYLGIPVAEATDDTPSTWSQQTSHKKDDTMTPDIVREFDWLRKLIQ